jgi:hypothetical protein
VIEQVPIARTLTVAPETVHTADEVLEKVTGKPDVAVAAKPKGAVPSVTSLSGAKVMLWL